MKRKFASRAFFLFALLMIASVPHAADNPILDTKTEEEIVSDAISASLLGEYNVVRKIARVRKEQEDRMRDSGEDFTSIAENVEALGLATQRPLPRLYEVWQRQVGYPDDRINLTLDRAIRKVEPRQRFLEARSDRRYESKRRIFNGIAVPVSLALQGQIFALLAIPFDAADYILIGRIYPSPEHRREIYEADSARRVPVSDWVVREAESLTAFTKRRKDLLWLRALQARENGVRAAKEEQYHTAAFWFERERILLGDPTNKGSWAQKTSETLARDKAQCETSLTVANPQLSFYSPREFGLYTDILRLLLVPDSNRELQDSSQEFLAVFPTSYASDEVRAAMATSAWKSGDETLGAIHLEELAKLNQQMPWKSRAAALMKRTEFSPEAGLEQGQAKVNDFVWNFIIYGHDPELIERSLTADEARQTRRFLVYRARGLFLTDTIARILALPFVDPFPKEPLLDAAARVDPEYFNTPKGQKWLRRVYNAQLDEHRYADAVKSARQLGEGQRIPSIEHKAARRLEKLAQESDNLRESAEIYRRLVSAYPSYKYIQRVKDRLADLEAFNAATALITVEELKEFPQLTDSHGLNLRYALLDGEKSNGEVGDPGILIMKGNSYSYKDRDTGKIVEISLTSQKRADILRELEPIQRQRALDRELEKPLPRKRIPIAIEAGVFPGIDVAPSMVPLDPDVSNRKLFQ